MRQSPPSIHIQNERRRKVRLSKEQVEDRLTAAWGREAVVVPWCYGNSHSFAVTDHGDHWMPLVVSWAGVRQVFEPANGDWPEVEQDSWDLAVVKAAELARAYFEGQGNWMALRRLPRGMVIVHPQKSRRARIASIPKVTITCLRSQHLHPPPPRSPPPRPTT